MQDTPSQIHKSGPARKEFPAAPGGKGWQAELFEGLPGMAYVARNDRARTVELASGGSESLLGLKAQSVPFALAPLIHPAEREQVLEIIKTAAASNHPFAVEYRLRHADGGWRTVWEQGRPFRLGPRPAIQGQLLDVTPRVRREHARVATELALLQSRRFEALNQLASGVAHEFNNLIAGILGSAELLAMDLPEEHACRETLKQIFEASNQARDFVHKLRVVGQRPTAELKALRLQPLIEETVQILRSIIPPKVDLQAELDPACPEVNADAAQLHQAILDLCLHAWQGLEGRRGQIKLSLQPCAEVRPPAGTVSLLQPGPHVCLTVQDNSPGLEKKAGELLFHPFRCRRPGGTKVGLELFLVRETIQAHQGEIFLETEPGRGLRFLIYLPVAGKK